MVITNFSEFTIFFFLITFVSIVVKATKHTKSIIIIIIINKNTFSYKEKCHILNQLLQL